MTTNSDSDENLKPEADSSSDESVRDEFATTPLAKTETSDLPETTDAKAEPTAEVETEPIAEAEAEPTAEVETETTTEAEESDEVKAVAEEEASSEADDDEVSADTPSQGEIVSKAPKRKAAKSNSVSGKVIAAVLVVVALAGGGLWAQWSSSSSGSVSLSSADMEILVNELFPPAQQSQLASDPEQKGKLVKNLRQILAVAQYADQHEGYGKKPEVKSQIDLQSDLVLREAYMKKNPGAQMSDDEVNAYFQAHPNEFNEFLDANPQYKQQAQGPQGEKIKRQYGEIKAMAEKARKEGIDKDRATQIRLLLERSQTLFQAYISDYNKNMEKQSTDAEIEQYVRNHQDKLRHVRHILISTQAQGPEAEPDQDKDKAAAKGKKEEKPKQLTDEEARQKAQSVLDRLHKGENFATLASEYSDDQGSKTKGGDLGFVTEDDPLVLEFKKVALSLEPGQMSDLVKTEFGYHIIKVDPVDQSLLSDPETKEKISQEITRDKIEAHINEIVANSNVQVAENFEIKPQPAMPQIMPSVTPQTPPTH